MCDNTTLGENSQIPLGRSSHPDICDTNTKWKHLVTKWSRNKNHQVAIELQKQKMPNFSNTISHQLAQMSQQEIREMYDYFTHVSTVHVRNLGCRVTVHRMLPTLQVEPPRDRREQHGATSGCTVYPIYHYIHLEPK